MTTKLNPYLNFRGAAREAMETYRAIFGGDLTISTFGEFGMDVPDAEKDQVMHSQLSGGVVEFMGADVPSSMPFDPSGGAVTMSLFGTDEPELRGFFERLADGGAVTVPLEKAPWGDHFGMLTDRFGIGWMVNISGGEQA